MLSSNNWKEQLRKQEPKKQRFAIKKLTVGVASVLIGFTFMGLSASASADEVPGASHTQSKVADVNTPANEGDTSSAYKESLKNYATLQADKNATAQQKNEALQNTLKLQSQLPVVEADAMQDGYIKHAIDETNAANTLSGKVFEAARDAGSTSTSGLNGLIGAPDGTTVYMQWMDKDGSVSPTYSAQVKKLSDSASNQAGPGNYAFDLRDGFVDAKGKIHKYNCSGGQKYKLWVNDYKNKDGNTMTMFRQAGGYFAGSWVNSMVAPAYGQFPFDNINMQRTGVFMYELPGNAGDASSYMTGDQSKWVESTGDGSTYNGPLQGEKNSINGRIWYETTAGESTITDGGPTYNAALGDVSVKNTDDVEVFASTLTTEGVNAFKANVASLPKSEQAAAVKTMLEAHPEYVAGTVYTKTFGNANDRNGGWFNLVFPDSIPLQRDYIYVGAMNSKTGKQLTTYSAFIAPVFGTPNGSQFDSHVAAAAEPTRGKHNRWYNVGLAIVPNTLIQMNITNYNTTDKPAMVGAKDPAKLHIDTTELSPAGSSIQWYKNGSTKVGSKIDVPSLNAVNQDGIANLTVPADAKDGDVYTAILTSAGREMASASFMVHDMDNDLYEPNYKDSSTTPGVKAEVPVTYPADSTNPNLNKDGKAPAGTKYGVTPGSTIPSWETVDPDTGTITVNPGSDAQPGNYDVPVTVTYPDGSQDNTIAHVVVKGSTTNPNGTDVVYYGDQSSVEFSRGTINTHKTDAKNELKAQDQQFDTIIAKSDWDRTAKKYKTEKTYKLNTDGTQFVASDGDAIDASKISYEWQPVGNGVVIPDTAIANFDDNTATLRYTNADGTTNSEGANFEETKDGQSLPGNSKYRLNFKVTDAATATKLGLSNSYNSWVNSYYNFLGATGKDDASLNIKKSEGIDNVTSDQLGSLIDHSDVDGQGISNFEWGAKPVFDNDGKLTNTPSVKINFNDKTTLTVPVSSKAKITYTDDTHTSTEADKYTPSYKGIEGKPGDTKTSDVTYTGETPTDATYKIGDNSPIHATVSNDGTVSVTIPNAKPGTVYNVPVTVTYTGDNSTDTTYVPVVVTDKDGNTQVNWGKNGAVVVTTNPGAYDAHETSDNSSVFDANKAITSVVEHKLGNDGKLKETGTPVSKDDIKADWITTPSTVVPTATAAGVKINGTMNITLPDSVKTEMGLDSNVVSANVNNIDAKGAGAKNVTAPVKVNTTDGTKLSEDQFNALVTNNIPADKIAGYAWTATPVKDQDATIEITFKDNDKDGQPTYLDIVIPAKNLNVTDGNTPAPEQGQVTINYVGDGKLQSHTSVSGTVGTNVDVASTIKKDVPTNWKIDPSYTVPKQEKVGNTITVPVVHDTKTVTPGEPGVDPSNTEYKDLFESITRTINVVNPITGQTEPNTQTVVFGRTGVMDEVTGNFVEGKFGPWKIFANGAFTNSDQGAWDGFTAPEFTGYTPSQASVAAQPVTPTTPSTEITITYSKNTPSTPTQTDADKYTPEPKPITTPENVVPKASEGINNIPELPSGTTFTWTDPTKVTNDVKTPGTYNEVITVKYPDGSQETVVTTVTVPSDADTYTPEPQPITTPKNVVPNPADGIKNKPDLPEGTKYTWADPNKVADDVKNPGTHTEIITVTYPDGSQDTVVTTVTVPADPSDADTHTPEPQPIHTPEGVVPDPSDGIKNKPDLPEGTKYTWGDPDKVAQDVNTPGVHDETIIVTYPDGSQDVVTVQVVVDEPNNGDNGQHISGNNGTAVVANNNNNNAKKELPQTGNTNNAAAAAGLGLAGLGAMFGLAGYKKREN